MTQPRRPGERPSHVKPPANLSPSPPVPEPRATEDDEPNSPTRYGDWERKGIAVDF